MPAKADITEKEVLRNIWEWVSKGYYDFDPPPLDDIPDSHPCCLTLNEATDYTGKTATLHLLHHSAGGYHYLAAQLEKPDDENNLVWQAGCILERSEQEDSSTIFHIFLNRGILQPETPANLSVPPRIPDIVGILLRHNLAAKETNSHDLQNARFPELLVNPCFVSKHKNLFDDLQGALSPIAHFNTVTECINATDDIDIQIRYPIGKINLKYSLKQAAGNIDLFRERIIADVIRMVSEVQSKRAITWQQLTQSQDRKAIVSLSDHGNYCYMNAAMAALLRQARQQCGFSQKELAQRVNSSGLIISRLETSRIQRVLRKLLNEIEEALQLPKNAIVSLQEKSTTPSFSQGNEATINTCPSTAPTEDFTKQTVQKKGYCRHCGTHLYEDSRFCSNCGKEVLF